MQKLLGTIATSVALTMVITGSAMATTVVLNKQNISNIFADQTGGNQWAEIATYSLNGVTSTSWSGAFRLTATNASGAVSNFLGFCLEPFAPLSFPATYTVGSVYNSVVTGRLGALVANAMSQVNDPQSAAAFTFAAREIANEAGPLDLQSGSYQLIAANGGSMGLAQSWLDLISAGTWAPSQQLTVLHSATDQDFITDLPPAPVPLPAAGLMLMGALGGLSALRRNRLA